MTPAAFETLALEVFRLQYHQNVVYAKWVKALGVNPDNVANSSQIPFLPVSFFKTHQVVAGSFTPQVVFQSSGTTGMVNSRHLVKDLQLYTRSYTKGFRHFYGDPKNWCIIGLLPSYVERGDSSLTLMVEGLMQLSGHAQNGFYLYDFAQLATVLQQLEAEAQPTLLIGVTFALLDFAFAVSNAVAAYYGNGNRRNERASP